MNCTKAMNESDIRISEFRLKVLHLAREVDLTDAEYEYALAALIQQSVLHDLREERLEQ